MRRLLAGLAVLLCSEVAFAQGVSDLFRSVTNALSGGQKQAPQQQGVTPVMGVRGMDQAEETAAAPAVDEDYTLMEGWAATTPEAEAFAKKKGLAKRAATLGKAQAAVETSGGSQ